METAIRGRTGIALALVGLVTVFAMWVDVTNRPLQLGSVTRDVRVRLGLDLRGGTHLVYRADVAAIPSGQVAEALNGVRDVIERRVNAFGVAEPVVVTNRVAQEYRVIVELAGVHDPAQAIQLIGETPQLDFRQEAAREAVAEQLNIDDPTALTGQFFARTELTGKHLKRASVSFDQVTGAPQVNLEFDSEGTRLFADLTRQNLHKRVAIYLDGVPISAPVVEAEITNGRAVVSGGFTVPEARQLAQRLNAGALPVPIELIGQQTIGPTLGQQSITASVSAGVLGLVAVVVWMVVFYRALGVVAALALGIYAILFLALIKLIPITLTLAGVTGFIMSIGMAVDANVLIFERFRENISAGKSVRYALENGFAEAWRSIWASNVTSLLMALILYSLGTSIVRGFALTFALGVILSMVSAVVVTRWLLLVALAWPALHRSFWLSASATKSV